MELDSAVTRVLTQAAKIVDAMPVELAAARRKPMNNRVGALQAERGFVAAVNEVSANDYAVGLRDWEERRALVNGWLARVAEEVATLSVMVWSARGMRPTQRSGRVCGQR